MPERQISDLPKNQENSLAQAHGAIPYGMTNDYMFRAVLQSSKKTLRGLVCSLLYLCRAFDQLCHGEDYSAVKPIIHIGFLDYTLFPDSPEFYATNKIMNVKTHKVYSDMLTLSVVDLTRTDLATDEDKEYHIDDWAALFKATTWEEIKMLASKDEYMNDAAQTMYLMSAEERIRKRCQDREDYYQDLRSYERKIDELDTLIQDLNTAIKDQASTIKNREATIQNQEQEILRLQAEIKKLQQQP